MLTPVQAHGPACLSSLQEAIPSSSDCGVDDSSDDSAGSSSAPALSPASTGSSDSPLPAMPAPEGEAGVRAASCNPLDAAAGLCSAIQHPDAQDVVPPASAALPDAPMDGSWLATCVVERRLGEVRSGPRGQGHGIWCRQLQGRPASRGATAVSRKRGRVGSVAAVG